ncbi:hypothetical protein ACFPOE_21685 [Caenimonas terrae]|uniref:Uncharacterized protein n=1 Tax=Caenimonas terrae TaxID=696074 RepID=A0ABW0NMN2_9BURK
MNQTPDHHEPASDGAEERVTGPFLGYHVAALGCFAGEGTGFRGFYRICREPPASYWTADYIVQGRCGPEASCCDDAMRMAEQAAASQIEAMGAGTAEHSPTSTRRFG